MKKPDKSLTLSQFLIDIPRHKELKNYRSITGETFVYSELFKDMVGVQSHTNFKAYNDKLSYYCKEILNKVNDLIQFHETSKFLVPETDLVPNNSYSKFDLNLELHEGIQIILRESRYISWVRGGNHVWTYNELIEYIKTEGLPYDFITELGNKIRILEPRFQLFHQLNE